MAEVRDVNDATFDRVLQADKPVIVHFWAPWCQYCRMMGPVVEELADEYDGRIVFIRLNADDNPHVCMKYNVQSVPTLIFFREGEPVGRVVGDCPKVDLKKRIDAVAG